MTRRLGWATAAVALALVLAIPFHVLVLDARPFVLTAVGRSLVFAFQRPWSLTILAVGVGSGLALRLQSVSALRRWVATPGRPVRMAGGASLASALALALGADRAWLDWPAAALLGAVAAGWEPAPNGRTRARREVLYVVAGFFAVSYAFTVFKAGLFIGRSPQDEAILTLLESLGGPVYDDAAAWGARHPGWLHVLDDVYFRIFDQMVAVSLFFAAAGRRAERMVMQSSLAFSYLLGAAAYYVVPAYGPAFVDPGAYGHMDPGSLQSAAFHDQLLAHSEAAAEGTLTRIWPYRFLAAVPSLHMAHEFIMLWYARHSRPLFAGKLVFAVLSAVAVLALGWHYWIDGAAGLLLALAAVALAERLRGRLFPAVLSEHASERPHGEHSDRSRGDSSGEGQVPDPDARVTARRTAGAVALALAALVGLTTLLQPSYALDVDTVGLRLALDRFAPTEHQPQPPGYLGWVWLLRWLQDVGGFGGFMTVLFGAQLAALVAAFATYRACCHWVSAGPRAWAVWLITLHPLVLYYVLDGQTHVAEAAAAALLLWAFAAYEREGARGALAMGCAAAFGVAVRPSFAVFAAGPMLVAVRRKPRHAAAMLLPPAAVAVLVTWGTGALGGGFEDVRAATHALVLDGFFRVNSPLSSEAVPRAVTQHLLRTPVWGLLAVAPWLAALAWAGRAGWRGRPFLLFVTAAVPGISFFLLFFAAEPGYMLPLVPFATVAAVDAVSRARGPVRSRMPLFLVASLFALAFVAGPGSPGSPFRWPTLATASSRQDTTRRVLDAVTADLDPAESALIVTDYADQTHLRQLPLARANTHVLFVHPRRFPIFERTTAGLATANGWKPIPGPALMAPGPPAVVPAPRHYDSIVIDPLATAALRHALARRTSCRLGSRNDPEPLDASCFPDGIEVGPHRLRFP